MLLRDYSLADGADGRRGKTGGGDESAGKRINYTSILYKEEGRLVDLVFYMVA